MRSSSARMCASMSRHQLRQVGLLCEMALTLRGRPDRSVTDTFAWSEGLRGLLDRRNPGGQRTESLRTEFGALSWDRPSSSQCSNTISLLRRVGVRTSSATWRGDILTDRSPARLAGTCLAVAIKRRHDRWRISRRWFCQGQKITFLRVAGISANRPSLPGFEVSGRAPPSPPPESTLPRLVAHVGRAAGSPTPSGDGSGLLCRTRTAWRHPMRRRTRRAALDIHTSPRSRSTGKPHRHRRRLVRRAGSVPGATLIARDDSS